MNQTVKNILTVVMLCVCLLVVLGFEIFTCRSCEETITGIPVIVEDWGDDYKICDDCADWLVGAGIMEWS